MNDITNKTPGVSLLNKKIYSVCYPPFDTTAEFHGTLYDARRRFLEKRKAVKVRENGIYSGLSGKTEGKLTRRKLKWKKTADGHTVESFFTQHKQRGIAFYAPGDILRCRIYFDRDLQWVRSEYFKPEDPLRARISFKPDPVRDSILRFTYNGATGTTKETVLLPVPYAFQTAEQSLQNAQFGEDLLLVSTDEGEFAYCPKTEQQKRLQFLEENRGASVMLSMGWEVRDGDIAPPDAALPESSALPVGEIGDDELLDFLRSDDDAVEEAPAEKTLVEEAAPAEEAPNDETPAEEESPVTEDTEEAAAELADELIGQMHAALDRISEEPTATPAALIRAGEAYNYKGTLKNGSRDGFGRTENAEGVTLYEGEYKDDKRDGFGAHHYRSGAMSYIGDFKDDKREGFGISFRETDHAMHLSRWVDGKPEGYAALFDPNGIMRFAGKIIDGKKQGAGVSIDTKNDTVFVAKYENNEPTGEGAMFAGDGTLLYVGGWLDGKRHGRGTEFDRNGDVIYSGEWKNDKYENGILYKKVTGNSEDGSN